MTSLSNLPVFGGPAPAGEAGTLVVANTALRAGFVQLPRSILHARGLSRDAKLLYAVLLSYAWQDGSCFPGYERLKGDLGCGINQITKYMRELEDARLISRRKRGQGKTTVYTLHDPPEQRPPIQIHSIGESGSTHRMTHQLSESAAAESVSAPPPNRRPEQDSAKADAEERQPQHPASGTTAAACASDRDAVVALLVEHGVTPRTAHELAANHPSETIRQQIEWHPYRGAMTKNPAGALVRAIRDGWAPPPSRAAASGHATSRSQRLERATPIAAPVAAPDAPQAVQETPLNGLWGTFAAALRPRLSAATYAAFVAPVLRAAPELPPDTRAATLVLPSAFAMEKWHRPPIQAAVAEAALSLGLALSLQAAAGSDESNTAAR